MFRAIAIMGLVHTLESGSRAEVLQLRGPDSRPFSTFLPTVSPCSTNDYEGGGHYSCAIMGDGDTATIFNDSRVENVSKEAYLKRKRCQEEVRALIYLSNTILEPANAYFP